jgi:hypothetical protein
MVMVTVREAPWTRSPTHSVTWAGRDSTSVGVPHFPRRSRRESPTEMTPPGQLIPSAARGTDGASAARNVEAAARTSGSRDTPSSYAEHGRRALDT